MLHANRVALGLEDRSRIWPLGLPRGLPRLKAVLRSADLVLAYLPYGGDLARAILAALGAPGLSNRVRGW